MLYMLPASNAMYVTTTHCDVGVVQQCIGVSWLEVVTFTVIKVDRHSWKCCRETTVIKPPCEHHRREVCLRL